MNALKKIEDIKKKLESAKEKRANINGKISGKIERLVELGFENTPSIMLDVKQELISLEAELEKKRKEFEKRMDELKEKYPQLFEG